MSYYREAMALSNLTSLLDPLILEIKGPNKKEFSLLQSPVEAAVILILYIVFIFKTGPKFMKNRNPFDLKKIIFVYNAVQIVLNFIVFIMGLRIIPNFNPCCSNISNANTPLDVASRRVHYYYMILKFLDLLDTVFYILRKKSNHVSFLHLHHHIGMASTGWITLKYLPGGPLIYVFVWNSLVHAVMYGYYLSTTLDLSRNILVKKSITQLQIVQHFLIFYVFITHLVNFDCTYSKKWLIYFTVNTGLTIYLFLKFYVKQYKKVCDEKVK